MKGGVYMEKKFIWIIVIIVIAVLGLTLVQKYTGYGIKGWGLCEDSDSKEPIGTYPRGENIFLEGTAKRSSISRIEMCSKEDPNNLREYYCKNPYLFTSKLITCEKGCLNGACVK